MELLILSVLASNLLLPRAMSHHQRTFWVWPGGSGVMDGYKGAGLAPTSAPPAGNESQQSTGGQNAGTEGPKAPWGWHLAHTGTVTTGHQPLSDIS